MGAKTLPFRRPVGDFKSRQLLTVAAAAERLSVCTKTIRTLCDRGELGAVRRKHFVRIPVEEVERWICANYEPPMNGRILR